MPTQRGSAVVHFVLIAAPLILTTLTVIAISLSSFALLVIRDSAVEGARFAALADQDSAAGCVRARQVARPALGSFVTLEVNCAGNELEEIVRINARFPIFGMISGARFFSATGRAPREH